MASYLTYRYAHERLFGILPDGLGAFGGVENAVTNRVRYGTSQKRPPEEGIELLDACQAFEAALLAERPFVALSAMSTVARTPRVRGSATPSSKSSRSHAEARPDL